MSMMSQVRFFVCSLLVKFEPIWLRPEELKFEAKKCFFCRNIDRTTVGGIQMKIFAHCLTFSGLFHPWFGCPFKGDPLYFGLLCVSFLFVLFSVISFCNVKVSLFI